jgi:hypothetical protein
MPVAEQHILVQDTDDLLFDSFLSDGPFVDHVGETGMAWNAGVFGNDQVSSSGGLIVNGTLYSHSSTNFERIQGYTDFATPQRYQISFEFVIGNQPNTTFFDLYGPTEGNGLYSYYVSFQPDANDTMYFSIQNSGDGGYSAGDLPYTPGQHVLRVEIDNLAGTKTVLWDDTEVCSVNGGSYIAGNMGFMMDIDDQESAMSIVAIKMGPLGEPVDPPFLDRRMLVF